MFGRSHSSKALEKISLAMSKKVYVYTAFGIDTVNSLSLYKSFNSCSDAAKELNCSNSTISVYRDTKKLLHNKWILSSSLLPPQDAHPSSSI